MGYIFTKRVYSTGHSFGIVIPIEIVKKLNLSKDDILEVEVRKVNGKEV